MGAGPAVANSPLVRAADRGWLSAGGLGERRTPWWGPVQTGRTTLTAVAASYQCRRAVAITTAASVARLIATAPQSRGSS